MIKGLLIVNAFLNTPQVKDTYDLLMAGGKRAGIDMTLATNAQFFADASGAGITPAPLRYDFILYWNKDVFLGRAFEREGYRLFNPAGAIESCDNKAVTFERLKGCCRVPKTIKIPMTFDNVGYDDLSFEDHLGECLGYPYVIKESLGSYGAQVYLAQDPEDARRILKRIEGRDALCQEFVRASSGRDLRAYVVGDRVVAAMERSNADDFRSNIANGGTARAYSITKEQEEMAVRATHKLGLDFAGVDLLLCEHDEPVLCEVNSNAQFRGLLTATGIDITDALFEHIKGRIA